MRSRAQRGGEPEGRLDPTKMVNQPALRTSSGRVWIIMGGCFAFLSLIPFGALIFTPGTRSTGVAIGAAVIIVVLYALLLIARFAIPTGVRRLRTMAVCMLSIAGVALVGIWICVLIEAGPR